MATNATLEPEAKLSVFFDVKNQQKGSLNYCPAPAKLNLFLHITGRRPDGYHLLETVFQLLDHHDVLHFSLRADDRICRTNTIDGVAENVDLTVRAARMLQTEFLQRFGFQAPGVDIHIEKQLPMGGGLGGGSSDAATTLMALNYLWNAQFSREQLMALGLRLGADVPFFIFGQNAFAQGVGEQLTAIETPARWYVVVEPGVMVSTAAIFGSSHLTRNTKPVRIVDFSKASVGFGKNDLQGVVCALTVEVAEAVAWLSQFGLARMTGSGACVFCAFETEHQADMVIAAAASLAGKLTVWKAKAITHHPMSGLL